MVELMKVTIISLYGQSIRKDFDEKYNIRSQKLTQKNKDERVPEYERQPCNENDNKEKSDPSVDKKK